MIQVNPQAEQVWKDFKKHGASSLKYKRLAQRLIPELAASKVYLNHGFATLEEAASKIAGISKNTVKKILLTHKNTENLPKLRRTMDKVGYDKISTVLSLKEKETENTLIKLVTNLPKAALREKVKELKNKHELHTEKQAELFEDVTKNSGYFSELETPEESQKTFRISIDVDAQTLQEWNKLKYALEKEKGHAITQAETLKHLVQQAKKSSQQLPKTNQQNPPTPYLRAATNKTLTPKHKAHLKQQNHNICQAKSCNQVATEVHHIDYQALNRENPQKHIHLKALCKVHHQLEHSFLAENTQNKSKSQLRIDQKVRSYWYLK